MVIGLAIYFLYGRSHSRLGRADVERPGFRAAGD
jgi:hypothetical protein